jgi:hypothetical protein
VEWVRTRVREGLIVNVFQATVSALGYSVLRERCPAPSSPLDFPNNRAVQFVLDQHARMPGPLRFALACATVAFGCSSLLVHGRMFHRLPHAARWQQVERWRNSPLGVCRDLIRFYDSLIVFHVYSANLAADADSESAHSRSAA